MVTESVTVNAVINGEEVPAAQRYPRENPANIKEVVGYGPVTTRDQAVQAIEAAAAAFDSWARVPLAERVAHLRRAADKAEAAAEELAHLLAREHGKPLNDARGEVRGAVVWLRYASDLALEHLKEQVHRTERGRTIITHDPVGVVTAITPWNFPLVLSMNKVAPALVAGNTVILKPSPFAPLAVSRLIKMVAEEFPPGVLNLVHGDADVGVELTSHPKVAKIAFTGSTKTARAILRSAADTIKNVTLELGGNDAAIVLPDFRCDDAEAFQRFVMANFLNAGQICMAAKRVYIHRSIWKRFIDNYVSAANQWIVVGDPFEEGVTVGPVNNRNQLEFVRSLVDGARQRGAEVVPLGRITDSEHLERGYFMQPALVLGAQPDDPIVTEEQFGPAVPFLPYDDEEEVIRQVNDSIYGLTGSVWGDEEHALQVSRRIQAGTTMVNTASVLGTDLRFPFGGVKQSGIGREHGPDGLLSYTEIHVCQIPDLPPSR